MARIHKVEKARKDQGKCGRCGAELPAGSSYRWVEIKTGQRSSRRMVRCMSPKCSFRPSELTTARRGEVYAVGEALEDFIAEWGPADGLDDVRDAVSSAADEIREIAEAYREASQNIVDGFGHETEQSYELESTADEVESYADEIGDCLGSIDELDDDATEAEIEDWAVEVEGAVESALSSCPV